MKDQHRQFTSRVLAPVLMLILMSGLAYAQSTPLQGSFGFQLNFSQTQNNTDRGTGWQGVMTLDGARAVKGSLILQTGSNGTRAALTIPITFTGNYFTNPDGTGSMKITLDDFSFSGVSVSGLSITFAMVVTDGGQGIQLAVTNVTGGDLGEGLTSGFARPVYTGPLQGSYGFQFNNSPRPGGALGVVSFDGEGKATLSVTYVGANRSGSQPPVAGARLNGTYSTNPAGTGVIDLPLSSGSPFFGTLAVVVTDGGSGLLLLLTNGLLTTPTLDVVSLGTARLQ